MIIGVDASRANCDQLTGTERYAFEVIRRLPRLRPDVRWRWYVREPLHARWGSVPSNVTVHVLAWPPRWLWTHLRLAWELLWHRPDGLFVPVGAVPIGPHLPTATTIHDVAFERYPELYGQATISPPRLGRQIMTALVRLVTLGRYGLSQLDYQRWSVRRAVQADIIFSVSEFTRRECQQLFGAAAERFIVTPLGADAEEARPRPPAKIEAWLKEQYRLERPYVLAIGRLETKKNIDGLLKAYAEFQRRHPEILDLVLIGSASDGWAEHRRSIPDQWIGRFVHTLGFVPDPDRLYILSAARALVFVSRYEGFGLPPIEAMNLGVPVIAARAAAIPEVVGQAALLVDPEKPAEIVEALERLNGNEQLRQRLITDGRAQAARYTWEQTASLTATGLDRLLQLRREGKNGTVGAA